MREKVTVAVEQAWSGCCRRPDACSMPLDLDYVRHWLRRIDSEEGARLARLERLIASGGRNL
jgi:hypothetical protein